MLSLLQQREKAMQSSRTGQRAVGFSLKAKSSLLLALSIIPLSSGEFVVV